MHMTKKFRQAFIDALDASGYSVAQVSRDTGVSTEQLYKLCQRETASTNVDDAVKLAHYFGKSLDEFLEDRTAYDRQEIVALYNQLTEQQREFLLDSTKGILSRKHHDN